MTTATHVFSLNFGSTIEPQDWVFSRAIEILGLAHEKISGKASVWGMHVGKQWKTPIKGKRLFR